MQRQRAQTSWLSWMVSCLALVLMPFSSFASGETEIDRFGRPVLDAEGHHILYDQDETRALEARDELEQGIDLPRPTLKGLRSDWVMAEKNSIGGQEEWHYVNYGTGIGDGGLVATNFGGGAHIAASASLEGFFANRYWYVLFEEFNDFFFVWESDLYDVDIRSLVAVDTNGDSKDEIVIGAGNRIEIHSENQGQISQTGSFVTAASRIDGLTIADVDGDSQLEAVFCQNNSAFYIYSLSGALEYSSTSYPCNDVAVGQVDDDADLEIVVSRGTTTGWVLNGVTRAEEWNRPGGFGTWVRTADLDGDGRDEIVAGFKWNGISIFDADTQTQGWSHSPSANISALRVADWDGDSQLEVLYGDGQFGSIHALDALTGTSEGVIANPKHGVTDILVADVRGAGESEVLWGAGYSTTGSDHLYLYDTVSSSLAIETLDIAGPFYGLGYGYVDGTAQVAYGSFESDAGLGDGLYVQRFADGGYNPVHTGAEPTGNSSFGQQRITMGSLGSSSAVVIVAADRAGYGKLFAYHGVYPHSEVWRTGEHQGFAFQGLQIIDVDSDGQAEVVASAGLQYSSSGTGGRIMVLERTDGFVEWQTELTNGLGDLGYLRVANVDGDANLEILVGEHGGGLWIYDGVTHAEELVSGSLSLTALDTADTDGDGVDEVFIGDSAGDLHELDVSTGVVSATLGSFGTQINGLQALDLNADGAVDFAFVLDGVVRIQSGVDSSILWQSPDLGAAAGKRDSLVVANIDDDPAMEVWVNQGVVGMKIFELNVNVTNQPPILTVIGPSDGAVVLEGDSVDFEATANDPEQGDLTSAIAWSSDIDGALGSGGLVTASPTQGVHTITASVSDSGGFMDLDSRTLTVNPGDFDPTVTITAPLDGATFVSGASISFSATAMDPWDNDISELVQWSNAVGEIGIGATVSAVLPDGAHTIYANVDDGLGNTAEQQISILVGDNANPVVTIVSPVDLSAGDTVTLLALEAAATDADGNTSFTWEWASDLDGAVAAVDIADVLLTEGVHLLTATATDPFGGQGSASVMVFSHGPSGAPLVRILSPAGGGIYTTREDITFTGVAHGVLGGDLTSTIRWGGVDTQDVGSPVISTAYSGEPSTITAKVEEYSPQTGEIEGSDTVQIDVFFVDPAPTVTIHAPVNGSLVYVGSDVEFSASALSDDGFPVTEGWVWSSDIDGQIGTGETFTNNGTLSSGVHTITATVENNTGPLGDPGIASITLTIAVNTEPSVSITTPLSSDIFHLGDAILFVGTASDAEQGDLSASIQWVSDLDGLFGSGSSVTFAGLREGSHQISAEITDDGGLSGIEAITIQVVNDAPVPTITVPSNDISGVETDPVTFAGTVTDTEDGDLSSSMQWVSDLDGLLHTGASFTTSTLSVGSHQISAEITDSGGAFALDAITVTVSVNTPPVVAVSSPTDGAEVTVGDSVTFTGSAIDGQDGDISAALSWSSDLDGVLGSGSSFASTVLSVGTHAITAAVGDSHGLSGIAQVILVVRPAPVQVTFTSIAGEDGRVEESSENSNQGGKISATGAGNRALRVGDRKKDRQLRSILSFNTSSIPSGAQVESVTLRIRRGNLIGQNPHEMLGACLVDIATGSFGASATLEKSDFEATADAVAVANLSNPTANLDWAEGAFNAGGLAAINLEGRTQVRVYFETDDNDDGGNDYLGFHSGEASASNRPELVVTYRE